MTKYLYCAFNLLYFLCMFTLFLLSPLVPPGSPSSFRFFHSFQRGYERPKSGKRDTREGGHERNTITALHFFDSEIAVGNLPFGNEGNDTISAFGKGSIYGWIMIIRWKDVLTTKLWCQPKIQPRSPSPLSSTLSLEGTMSPNILMT